MVWLIEHWPFNVLCKSDGRFVPGCQSVKKVDIIPDRCRHPVVTCNLAIKSVYNR